MSEEVKWDYSNECLFIKNGSLLHKVRISDLIWISSEGNYITLHTLQRQYVLKMSLKKISSHLPIDYFCQIHRSFIVQIGYIDSIDMATNEIVLQDINLPIGRKYKKEFLDKLNLIQ